MQIRSQGETFYVAINLSHIHIKFESSCLFIMFVSPVTKQIFYLKPMVEDSFIKVDFIDPIFITGNLDE
jgi:hypothetical protein